MRNPLQLCCPTETSSRAVCVCLIMMLCGACSDGGPLAPENLSGEYTIVTAKGRSLPTYMDPDSAQNPEFRLLDARVQFDHDATVRLFLELEHNGEIVPRQTFHARYYLEESILNFAPIEDQQAGIGNKGLVLENGDIIFFVQAPCSSCCPRRLIELVASRFPGAATNGGVEHVVGSYVLTAIDGIGPPLVEEETLYGGGGREVLARADTITLLSDSTYRYAFHRYEIAYASSDSPPDTIAVHDDLSVGPYRLNEDALLVIHPLPLLNGEISHVWLWGDDENTIVIDARFNDWCPDGCPNWDTRELMFRRN